MIIYRTFIPFSLCLQYYDAVSMIVLPTPALMMCSLNISPTSNSGTYSDTGSILSDPLPQQQILRQSKGLRHFSKQVCDKVELKGVTTYNEVIKLLQ